MSSSSILGKDKCGLSIRVVSRGGGFESLPYLYGVVTQMVECLIEAQKVVGSSPTHTIKS